MIQTGNLRDAYAAAFLTEREQSYPVIDAIEARVGCALRRSELENAAAVLACPLKTHAPNWQHGRVLYALTRHYLSHILPDEANLLDIGTAKGFSALCLFWAFRDSRAIGSCVVTSLDVVDPASRERRNTIAEADGLRTLAEILAPWPEASMIRFEKSDARSWLTAHPERIHVAFVDGKHSYDAVRWEAALLAARQHAGDLAIFDDVQIPGVAQAVRELVTYDVEWVDLLPHRRYAIARRR